MCYYRIRPFDQCLCEPPHTWLDTEPCDALLEGRSLSSDPIERAQQIQDLNISDMIGSCGQFQQLRGRDPTVPGMRPCEICQDRRNGGSTSYY